MKRENGERSTMPRFKHQFDWTDPKNDRDLRDLFPSAPRAQLLARFPVTWGAIVSAANRKGIVRDYRNAMALDWQPRDKWEKWHLKCQQQHGMCLEPFPFKAIHVARLKGNLT